MEDKIQISIMLDYYGALLTSKQIDILDLYVNEDLSLKEISELTKTSRQAVHDIIKRCTKQLLIYEESLKLVKKNNEIENNKTIVIEKLTKVIDKDDMKKYQSDIMDVIIDINEFF